MLYRTWWASRLRILSQYRFIDIILVQNSFVIEKSRSRYFTLYFQLMGHLSRRKRTCFSQVSLYFPILRNKQWVKSFGGIIIHLIMHKLLKELINSRKLFDSLNRLQGVVGRNDLLARDTIRNNSNGVDRVIIRLDMPRIHNAISHNGCLPSEYKTRPFSFVWIQHYCFLFRTVLQMLN